MLFIFSFFHSHFSIIVLSFVLDTPLAAALELTVAWGNRRPVGNERHLRICGKANYVSEMSMWLMILVYELANKIFVPLIIGGGI